MDIVLVKGFLGLFIGEFVGWLGMSKLGLFWYFGVKE